MLSSVPAPLLLAVCVVQVVGLASMFAARIGERSDLQLWCQLGFFALFALVALSTLLMLVIGCAIWPLCGLTLSVMAIGATIDLRSSHSSIGRWSEI
jgi:hypothetical protein